LRVLEPPQTAVHEANLLLSFFLRTGSVLFV